jgi:hypothetical protein
LELGASLELGVWNLKLLAWAQLLKNSDAPSSEAMLHCFSVKAV